MAIYIIRGLFLTTKVWELTEAGLTFVLIIDIYQLFAQSGAKRDLLEEKFMKRSFFAILALLIAGGLALSGCKEGGNSGTPPASSQAEEDNNSNRIILI
ncbi:MAG: hypothetical protein Q4A37_00680 [Candidatus Saccharibacteria bacterium]|nr:hypothetical protein [Candidatus Saccharibacteria bacterium]